MKPSDLRAEARKLRKAARYFVAALWVVGFGSLIFTCVNVTLFAIEHKTWPWVAWLLDPIVNVTLAAVILGDNLLSRHGERPHAWGVAVKYFCAAATLAMNSWASVAARDVGGTVLHAVPPLLLVGLAEVAPRYQAKLFGIADRLDAEANAAASRAANDAAERERTEAEREAAVRAAEAERETERLRLEAANAELERERLKTEREANRLANAPNVRPERKPRTRANTASDLRERGRPSDEDSLDVYAAWLSREGATSPMSNRELADLLGVSVDAARVRANRWRQKAASPDAAERVAR